MPIPACRTADGAAVAGTVDETAGFIRKRSVWCIRVWSQRIFTDIYTITIHVKFRAGRGILQVIFPIMLHHGWPLDLPAQHGIAVIMAAAFPPVPHTVEVYELENLLGTADESVVYRKSVV